MILPCILVTRQQHVLNLLLPAQHILFQEECSIYMQSDPFSPENPCQTLTESKSQNAKTKSVHPGGKAVDFCSGGYIRRSAKTKLFVVYMGPAK
jgi:hypothetical protein